MPTPSMKPCVFFEQDPHDTRASKNSTFAPQVASPANPALPACPSASFPPHPCYYQFILKDATLNSYYDTWLRNYEGVLQYVASERDIPSSDSEDASRGDEVGSAMDEESESEVCPDQGDGDRPSGVQDKRRTQDTNGAPAKKRRGGSALPADDPDDTYEDGY